MSQQGTPSPWEPSNRRATAQADVGMSEHKAKILAVRVRQVLGHDVEVRAEDAHFVVDVRRTVGSSYIDVYTLRDEQDWRYLSKRTRHCA